MEKKKRVYYEIFLFLLFFISLIEFICCYVDFKDLIEHIKYYSDFILGVIVILFKNLLICSPMIGGYFGVKIAYKKHLKSKLEKIDFKNDNYYRDIIKEYSVGAIGYIDDFKVNINDIIAVLLGLELKEKIKIGEKITIIDQAEDGLMKNEKYILKNLYENNLKKLNIYEYTKILIEDCKDKQLLKRKSFNVEKFYRTRIIIMIILIIMCPILASIDAVGVVFLIMLFVVPAFFISTVSLAILNGVSPHVRSEEGKILNTKIKGLKKYLKEYSNMEDKEKKELMLWEDYLIYSVIFNINNKVVEEINEKLK